jgi:hypothetical protein
MLQSLGMHVMQARHLGLLIADAELFSSVFPPYKKQAGMAVRTVVRSIVYMMECLPFLLNREWSSGNQFTTDALVGREYHIPQVPPCFLVGCCGSVRYK